MKYNADGSINCYKARLVAKGYAQTHVVDYEETFDPMAKMTTVWTLIALAAAKGWHLHQIDARKRLSTRRIRKGGVHGTTTQLTTLSM